MSVQMSLSGLILLTSLWFLAVLLIVSFLAGAKRLRGEDELAEEPLPDATEHPQSDTRSLASHAGDRS